MSNEDIIKLTESEKKSLFPSLYYMTSHLHEFVNLFYDNLLKTDVGKLFRLDQIENQKKKFESTFKIILYNIQHPINLQDLLNVTISKHLDVGIRPDHIDIFNNTFLNSLINFFQNNFDEEIIKIWRKLLRNILNYFKQKIA